MLETEVVDLTEATVELVDSWEEAEVEEVTEVAERAVVLEPTAEDREGWNEVRYFSAACNEAVQPIAMRSNVTIRAT